MNPFRKQRLEAQRKAESLAIISILFFCAVFIAAWLTHIFTTLMNEQWLLLIAGAILVPIGTIHGIGIWLGIF